MGWVKIHDFLSGFVNGLTPQHLFIIMFLIESRKPDTIGPIATLSCRVTNVGKIAVPPQLRYI